MKTSKFSIIIVLLIFSISFMQTSCSSESDASSLSDTQHHQETAINVQITPLQQQKFAEYIEAPGVVGADIATKISAEESGVVKRILAEKGTQLKAGELILELDSQVIREAYNASRAAYEAAKERFERQTNLRKENAISEQQFLDTKFAYQQAKASMEGLKARMNKTQITSPIDGRIDARHVEIGEYVNPGTALVDIIKTDIVKVEAGIPERYIADVKKNASVEIEVDILDDASFEGKITFLGSTIHPTNRTFPIEVKLANPKGALKQNMFAKVRIKRKEFDNGFVVPRDAIVETENGKALFVAKGRRASRIDVKVKAVQGNEALVEGAFQVGDSLIIRGHRELVPDERIAIQSVASN